MVEQFDRALPCSIEAEQAVLGSILIDPACLDALVGMLSAEDFYLREHVEIYKAMQQMYLKSKNVDVVTLLDELVQSGTYDEAGGREYLRLVAEAVPTAANASDYGKIVKDKAVLRKLIEVGESIAEAAYMGDGTPESLVEMAESTVYKLTGNRDSVGFVSIQDALMRVYDTLTRLKENPEENRGMTSGFQSLDDVIVGMGKGDLVLVGARPGMGKTAFAMNIATSAAERTKKTVCVFSLEMSAEQLVNRMIASEGQVDSHKLRAGTLEDSDWTAVAYAANRLSELSILIDDTPGISVAMIKSKLRRVKNIGMVVIDYLQLMQTGGRENRVQEVGEISRGLKLLAKELCVPVVCCAQLSRSPESRPDKRPMLSDLRDSGAIEQDADIVMFLYRDEYYKDESPDKSVAEVIVAKNRHGSLANVKLGWLAAYTRFVEIAQ